MKNILFASFLALMSLPMAGQAWDIRLEVPFPKGQSLPKTMLSGTSQAISGDLDTGNGGILSVSHRLLRIGPILRLEWGGELAILESKGQINFQKSGTSDTLETLETKLMQMGFGVGVNAQLWVPFLGISGEIGAIRRFQQYKHSIEGAKAEGTPPPNEGTLSKTWLRVGGRWRVPLFRAVHPYIAASYQQPITKEHPVRIDSAANLADYFNAQGEGQEFDRMWTFGVGITF
jgi:hypothetical protein